MHLDMNDPTMKAIVAEAVLRSIDGKARDALLTAAITHLITPKKDHYGRAGESPLQDAFNDFAREQCRTSLRDLLAKDPGVIAAIESFTAKVVRKMLTNDKVVDIVADRIADAMAKSAREE